MSVSAGSSPLARGLQVHGPEDVGGLGIIPARAGFTFIAVYPVRRVRDHPRSRGVYARWQGRLRAWRGSSPLARGLRHVRHRSADGERIIPARAGFTASGGTCGRGRRDHPRSRGVYRAPRPGTPRRLGSSPLARGLRLPARGDHNHLRIIPARAGFTLPSRCASTTRKDHPRSRGVYAMTDPSLDAIVGSSPLARGLPYMFAELGEDRRIIPARAGFTTAARGRLSRSGDHPRSRGVYQSRWRSPPLPLGSSPLARGLLLGGVRVLGGVGIIPARAGFTRPPLCSATGGWDHPRSRGVYR